MQRAHCGNFGMRFSRGRGRVHRLVGELAPRLICEGSESRCWEHRVSRRWLLADHAAALVKLQHEGHAAGLCLKGGTGKVADGA